MQFTLYARILGSVNLRYFVAKGNQSFILILHHHMKLFYNILGIVLQ